jgi:hypothetical protein
LLIDSASATYRDETNALKLRSFAWRSAAWAVAACLLVGLTIAAISSFGRKDRSRQNVAAVDAETESPSALGHLKALRPDTNWSFGKPGQELSEQVFAGDTLWLDKGAAELHLANKTVARLEAPLILQAVSLDRFRMLQGRITVDVAKGTEGFTVETASAEVIDLGTTFSVEVADNNTDVVVFQGVVDLRVAELDDSILPASANPTKRLHAGEAVRVSRDRTLSRIVNVQQTSFDKYESADGMPYSAVIANVTDNINRDDLWSFYEIVPGGMGEDQKCYVDRPYEWNGATADGMPGYLAGGDYVKTFCNDKITEDLNIELTLNRAANLYVLFDKRAVPPDWLLHSFEATGDDIGIDETRFDVWKQEPIGKDLLEVGPGNGVERRCSIWRRVVTEAGAVPLGPNGVPIQKTKSLDLNAEVVMYGIVAVPIGGEH